MISRVFPARQHRRSRGTETNVVHSYSMCMQCKRDVPFRSDAFHLARGTDNEMPACRAPAGPGRHHGGCTGGRHGTRAGGQSKQALRAVRPASSITRAATHQTAAPCISSRSSSSTDPSMPLVVVMLLPRCRPRAQTRLLVPSCMQAAAAASDGSPRVQAADW